MGYYDEIKMANKEIDDAVQLLVLDQKKQIDIDNLVLEITKKYAIGTKPVLDRLERLIRCNPLLKIKNRKLITLEA